MRKKKNDFKLTKEQYEILFLRFGTGEFITNEELSYIDDYLVGAFRNLFPKKKEVTFSEDDLQSLRGGVIEAYKYASENGKIFTATFAAGFAVLEIFPKYFLPQGLIRAPKDAMFAGRAAKGGNMLAVWSEAAQLTPTKDEDAEKSVASNAWEEDKDTRRPFLTVEAEMLQEEMVSAGFSETGIRTLFLIEYEGKSLADTAAEIFKQQYTEASDEAKSRMRDSLSHAKRDVCKKIKKDPIWAEAFVQMYEDAQV